MEDGGVGMLQSACLDDSMFGISVQTDTRCYLNTFMRCFTAVYMLHPCLGENLKSIFETDSTPRIDLAQFPVLLLQHATLLVDSQRPTSSAQLQLQPL